MSRRACAWLASALLLSSVQAASAEQPVDRKKAAAVNAELAITYMKQDNLRAAREKVDKALDQDPRSADVQMAAGFVYDRLGEDRKAGGHFEQAVKLGGKDNPDVFNNAAVFQCRKGDKKRGEELFLQAAASPLYRMPEVAYANAGHCARDAGRPKEAERYYRDALKLRPNMPDALIALADLLHAEGSDLQARAFVQRYHDAAAATSRSVWLGYRIERAQGDAAAAEVYARRLRMEFPTSDEAAKLFDEERKAQ